MTTITKSATHNGHKITVKLTRRIDDRENRLDGQLTSTSREIYEAVEVTLHHASGRTIHSYSGPEKLHPAYTSKELIAKGAYARVGDAYISQEMYELVTGLISEADAEIGKSDEQVAMEAEAAKAQAKADAWLDSDEYRQMREFERKMNDPYSDY